MSRHYHKPVAKDINVPGKKSKEREARIRAARQRKRLQMFIALISMILDGWHRQDISDDIDGLPPNERRFLRMQIAKCEKSVNAAIAVVYSKSPASDNAFCDDTKDVLKMLLHEVCSFRTMPEVCSYMDIHAVMSYLVYAALYELWRMEDQCQEVITLIRNLGVLCDHIIPNDSPLLLPMNGIFWTTRDRLHSGALLPVWDFDKCPKGTAEWERRHRAGEVA